MAVAHSAASESHTGTTGSTNQAAFSWTHTQTGTPQGVLVFVTTFNSTASLITGVTYGSIALQRVSGAIAQDAAGEPGRVDLFFSSKILPTGNATITVNRTNNATTLYASAATVTAARPIECTGVVLVEGDGTLAQVNIDDGTPGTNSLRYAAAYSGLASPPPAGANSTLLNNIDIGQYGAALCRETTAGQGSRPVGFAAASDDRAAIHVAVRELPLVAGNASTNLLSNNEAFPLATWPFRLTGVNLLIKDTSQASPFGYGTAFRFTEGLTSGPKTQQTVSLTVSPTGFSVFSIYAKSNGRNLRVFISYDATTVRTTYDFTLSGSGTATLLGGTGSPPIGEIESVGGGWYRCSVGINATTTDIIAQLGLLNGGADSYTGDGVSGVYVWGPQLEQDPVVGGYNRNPSTLFFENPEALFSLGNGIGPDVGTFALTGNNATLTKSGLATPTLAAATGAFSLVGQPAGTRHNAKIDANTGTFALTGNPATTRHNPKIDGGVGAFSLTGRPATFPRTRTLAAEMGAFALNSNGATLRKGYAVTANTGTFTIVGPPATTRHNPKIDGATGAFALTGGNPALLRGRYLSGGSGTFIETGQPATFRRTRVIQGGTGVFTLTGRPAALTEVGAYEIDPIVGEFTLTGQSANLAQSRSLPVTAGVFTLTGQPATLRHNPRIGGDTGTFALDGGAPSLRRSSRVSADVGTFSLTGNPASLTEVGVFGIDPIAGTFALTGNPATLTALGALKLNAERGQFLLTGNAAGMRTGRSILAATGSFDLNGGSINVNISPNLTGATGAFALTGNPASLAKSGIIGRRRNVLIF